MPLPFDPARFQWGEHPLGPKPSLYVGKLTVAYEPPPAPGYDTATFGTNETGIGGADWIVGLKAPAFQMAGVQVAAALATQFTGEDLVNMVGIAYRESTWHPHQIVRRNPTRDYSFGLLGFNMRGSIGTSRRKSLGIDNIDLIDPLVTARAGRWLFNAGLKSKGDGLWHWGAYKGDGHTGLTGVNLTKARKAVSELFVAAPVAETKYFQGVMNAIGLKDSSGRPLKVDGIYGTKTQSVCQAYQAHVGLPVTGDVSAVTWRDVDLDALRYSYRLT